jgi:hypothetical protein
MVAPVRQQSQNADAPQGDTRVPTLDGTPLARAQLNTAVPALLVSQQSGPLARLALWYRRLNDILSGMYTGVRCGGTPHSHHNYERPDSNTRPREHQP